MVTVHGELTETSEDVVISDAELTALALAADPDTEAGPDAVPFQLAVGGAARLPEWYMPAVAARIGSARRWQKLLVGALVLTLVGIEISGLCSVFGQLVIG